MKEIGLAIKARRRRLGLTQRDVSEIAGCGERLVHEVESGKETVRLDRLLAILKVLGMQLTLTEGSHGLVLDGK